MTDKNVKSQADGKVASPVLAAVAGAVVGGIAVASAMIMSNKDNQDKVKKVVATGVDKVTKLEDIAKNTVEEVKNI